MPGRGDMLDARYMDRRVVRLRGNVASSGSFIATCLDHVVSEPVVWLWDRLIARGMVTLLTGASSVGKTFVGLDIAAAVTRGDQVFANPLREPGDDPQAEVADDTRDSDDSIESELSIEGAASSHAGDVMLMVPECDLADIVKPRLQAARADMSRVFAARGIRPVVTTGHENSCWLFQLTDDLKVLEKEIGRRKAAGSPLRLIVIDPFPLELFDERSGQTGLKQTLQQLAEIAARTGTAILMIANCPSNLRSSLPQQLRTLESTVTSVWRIFHDLDRAERRLLLPVKTNLSEQSPGRAFELREGRVAWHPDPIGLTAGQYLEEAAERSRSPLFEQEWSELARASRWLQLRLKQGPVEFRTLKQQAAELDLSDRTLRRALCALHGESHRIEGVNGWQWSLPNHAHLVDPPLPRGIDPCRYENETEFLLTEQGRVQEAAKAGDAKSL